MTCCWLRSRLVGLWDHSTETSSCGISCPRTGHSVLSSTAVNKQSAAIQTLGCLPLSHTQHWQPFDGPVLHYTTRSANYALKQVHIKSRKMCSISMSISGVILQTLLIPHIQVITLSTTISNNGWNRQLIQPAGSNLLRLLLIRHFIRTATTQKLLGQLFTFLCSNLRNGRLPGLTHSWQLATTAYYIHCWSLQMLSKITHKKILSFSIILSHSTIKIYNTVPWSITCSIMTLKWQVHACFLTMYQLCHITGTLVWPDITNQSPTWWHQQKRAFNRMSHVGANLMMEAEGTTDTSSQLHLTRGHACRHP